MPDEFGLLPEGEGSQGAVQGDVDGPVAQMDAAAGHVARLVVGAPELAAGRHAQLPRQVRRRRQEEQVERPLHRTVLLQCAAHLG